MSGFQFPPPPPPPPKTSYASDDGQTTRFGSANRGRGNIRGNSHQLHRGRGGHNPRNQSQQPRNEYGNRMQVSHTNQGNLNNDTSSSHPRGSSTTTSKSQNSNIRKTPFPPGAYINPAFFNGISALPQTLENSSSSTYGHGSASQNSACNSIPNAISPARNTAGHKRKLEAPLGPGQERSQAGPPTAPPVPSFGGPIAQGADLSYSTQAQKKRKGEQGKRSSNLLGLTPQDDQQYSFSESDENDGVLDEEALHAELGTTLTFEHDGNVTTLNSAAELATWRAERKKNWPTKARWMARVEEKRRLGEIRKRLINESVDQLRRSTPSKPQQRRLDNKEHLNSEAEEIADRLNVKPPQGLLPPEPRSKLANARNALDFQEKTLEELRKSVKQSENLLTYALKERSRAEVPTRYLHSSASNANTAVGEDLPQSTLNSVATEDLPYSIPPPDIDTGVFSDNASAVEEDDLAEEELLISSSSSISSSTSSSDNDSDEDAPPEEVSSKPSVVISTPDKQPCKFFTNGQYCKHGGSCKFLHNGEDAPVNATMTAETILQQPFKQTEQRTVRPKTISGAVSAQKGIQQRLLEREENEQDHMALRVIKYLGRVGFFGEQE